jgi:hypothetical protein
MPSNNRMQLTRAAPASASWRCRGPLQLMRVLDATMSASCTTEKCPSCGETSAVRPKLLLIDEAWVSEPGKDERLKYSADLRVDDVEPGNLRPEPQEQFIDGYYCNRCGGDLCLRAF